MLTIAVAIFDETALAFLGLADPTSITWGTTIEFSFLRTAISSGAWWAVIPAGLCVALVIMACFWFGQAIEDALNPRLKVSLPLAAELPVPAAAPERGGVMALLEVRDLHVWFDLPRRGELHAVRGVSFDLDAGERVGLVGESGCGKTTTILAMLGLLPPSATVAGEVLLDGDNILADDEDTMRAHRWTDIAMVFQGAMNALNPVKTVESQIVEPMSCTGPRTAPRRRPGRASCWSWSGSRRRRAPATRTSSPVGCGSAPRSRWRWRASPRCCSPTSPRPRST